MRKAIIFTAIFATTLAVAFTVASAAAPHVKLRGGGTVIAARKAVIKIRGGGAAGGGGGSWSNGYAFRRTIVASSSLISTVSSTALTNFPMLVSSTLADMKTTGNGGQVQNASGYDIIFTSDAAGASKLNWETEKYVSSTGEMEQWVQVPTLSSSSANTIYMFYGKSGVSSFQSVATATWDGNYKGVWHLANGTTLTANDSTNNGNNGVASGTTATIGKIDGAASFDGLTTSISVSNIYASTPAALSTSVWAKIRTDDGSSNFDTLVDYGSGASGAGIYLEKQEGSTTLIAGVHVGTGGNAWGGASNEVSFTMSAGIWHKVDITISSTTMTVYVDGGSVGSATGTNDLTKAQQTIGIGYARGYLFGLLDEVRSSDIIRTADWISTEHNNQSSPSTFESIGAAVAGTTARATVKFR